MGLVGNIAEVLPELARRGIVPDVVTDQTSAHDLRLGYVPAGLSLAEAARMREAEPGGYERRVLDSMAAHVKRCCDLQGKGAVAFDYGNNLRGQVADHRGMKRRSRFPGSCLSLSARFSARGPVRFAGWPSPATRRISR